MLDSTSSVLSSRLIALQGKLERVPFDIPDAETEIVGGRSRNIQARSWPFSDYWAISKW